MYLRFVFGMLAIFAAVSEMIDGCGKTSETRRKPPKQFFYVRKTRDVNTPIVVGGSGFGLLLRSRNTTVAPNDTEAEELFRRIDANGNGMIDAVDWVDFSKETSVWDFVELLDYADVDDDEAVSLDEFLSVQILKIYQTVEGKNSAAVTSS